MELVLQVVKDIGILLAQVTLQKQQTAQGERRYAQIPMSRVGGIKTG